MLSDCSWASAVDANNKRHRNNQAYTKYQVNLHFRGFYGIFHKKLDDLFLLGNFSF